MCPSDELTSGSTQGLILDFFPVLKLETSEVSEEFRVINLLIWPWKATTIFILNFGPRMLSFKTRNIQDG